MQHAHWRLDTSIGHLLLDEFQDTSLPQWNVLKPFAAASCDGAGGHSFFCVGDVKQAIYRWRGGVSQLFDAVQANLPGVGEQSLTKSYRSSQPVIDTVNQVFEHLPANEALDDCPEVTRQWQEWFGSHSTTKTELGGYATLSAAPRAEDAKQQSRATLEFAAEQVANLAKQRPGRSIGVLTRRNKAVAQLIHLLRSKYKLPASQEGGNPLTDSAAVQLVLSLIKLADHPGDLAARFHAAGSPLGEIAGISNHTDNARAAQAAADLRRRLLDDGYGRTIYEWVKPLSACCGQRDLDRLIQLVELAYAFDRRAAVRPGEFVTYIEQTKVEDPSTASIRVMTVHQAKGLQFDIVVLPELEGRLKGITPQVAIGRPQPTEPIELVCRHISQDFWPLLPDKFQRIFEIWPREAVNESLCLLYVALTRAVHALHLIVPPTAENERTFPRTFTGILRSALVEGRKLKPGDTAYEHGDPNWFSRGEPKGSHDTPAAAALEPETLSVRLGESSADREMVRRSPSSLEGGGMVRLGHRLNPAGDAIFARGTLWHAWFEQIEWLDDDSAAGDPNDDRLRAIAFSIGHVANVDGELAEFRRVLSLPDVRRVLGRKAYDDLRQLGFGGPACAELARSKFDLRVHRERRFAVRDADALLNGSIDRLVLLERGGQVLAADVIDFKTDRLAGPDDLENKTRFYQPQIAAYRRAVGQLYHLEPGRITSRLVFVESGVVRQVD